VASISFDKGFTRTADRELLSLYVPTVVMPKRGRKNAAETQRESAKQFVALRHQHSAVESEINSLEHHGLNRCLDVGLEGYQRYVGYGVLNYNLHIIGRELLARQRTRRHPRAGGLSPPAVTLAVKSDRRSVVIARDFRQRGSD
jgi:IS5 family transposase